MITGVSRPTGAPGKATAGEWSLEPLLERGNGAKAPVS
jgi:hypothetical protein